MKKCLILALAMITSLSVSFSQERVVKKSGKRPKWVNGVVKDFIIVNGGGATIQTAQQNALISIKEHIVSAIADNVSSKSELIKEESTLNNVSTFLEKFATQINTQSGQVPFLQGISLSNADQYYWEEVKRKNKTTYYYYHIKYPFAQLELQQLVSDFKQRDNELTNQLENLIKQADVVTSVEQIEKNIESLKVMNDYFMDGRKAQGNLGIANYNSLLSSIELVDAESKLGELKYALRLGTRTISTTKKPITRSDCARITSTTNNQNLWVVNYDYANCYENTENNIHVNYRFGEADVQKKFYFDILENTAGIFIKDPFNFTTVSKGDSTIDAFILDMTIISKYDTPFTIEKVVIEWKGFPPTTIDGINQSFSGKGNHNLKLKVTQSIEISKTTSAGKSSSLLAGYIQFHPNPTGEAKTYKIYNQLFSTDW